MSFLGKLEWVFVTTSIHPSLPIFPCKSKKRLFGGYEYKINLVQAILWRGFFLPKAGTLNSFRNLCQGNWSDKFFFLRYPNYLNENCKSNTMRWANTRKPGKRACLRSLSSVQGRRVSEIGQNIRTHCVILYLHNINIGF